MLQRGARRAAHGLGAPLRLVARAEDRAVPDLVRRVVRAWRALALLAAVLVVAASAVHLQRYPELREAQREAAAGGQDASAGVPAPREVDPLDVAARRVGPGQGEDLDAYVEQRRAVLAALPAEATVVAVISFEEYTTADAATALLPDDVRILRAQYRIPAQGERPTEARVADEEPVGSIEAAIAEALQPIEDEITEVASLLESGTVDDPSFAEDLERRLSELRAVRNLLQAAPAIVFALVVEGSAGELQALAEHDAVRLVDPAPQDADPDRIAFYGLLPEDRDAASFGAAG